MNATTLIFLLLAGVLLVASVVLIFNKREKKTKIPVPDPDYAVKLREAYFNAGTVKKALNVLIDDYADNKYMTYLLTQAIEYLDGDYGDYETALSLVNPGQDGAVRKANEEIVSAEMIKSRALTGS